MGEAGQSREGESITPLLVSIMHSLMASFSQHTLLYAHPNEIPFGVNITFSVSV